MNTVISAKIREERVIVSAKNMGGGMLFQPEKEEVA